MAVSTSEELLGIGDEFNDNCKRPNCIGSIEGNTAAPNAHRKPDICILITKAFTQ